MNFQREHMINSINLLKQMKQAMSDWQFKVVSIYLNLKFYHLKY